MASEIKMKMSLDSSGVKRGISKAKASVKNFASSANKRLGSLAKIGIGALVAGFAALTRSAISLGSELSDITESTGFATEEFQVFRAALIDAGGKSGAMEKAINNMQKAVVQGGEGLTTYTRAFERLGLSVDDLRGMSPEDQFKTIAKATAEADDQQGAYTSSMEIFGTKIAPRMQEVFRRLAEDGYGKMASDAEDAYGIMGSAEQAALDKSADRIEQWKNKLTIKVGEIVSGTEDHAALKAFGYNLLGYVTAAGEGILNPLIDAGRSFHAAISATAVWVGERFTLGLKVSALKFQELIAPVVNSLVEGLNKIGFDLEGMDVSNVAADIQKMADDAAAGSQSWTDNFEAAYESTKNWKLESKNGSDQWHRMADEERAKLEARNKLEAERIAVQKEQSDEMAKQAAARIKAEKAAEEATKAADKAAKEAAKAAKEAIDQAIKDQEELDKSVKQSLNSDLLDAQIAQRGDIEHSIKREIALNERAQQIVEATGKSREESLQIAAKLMQIEAGPDADQSGYVTRKERRAWEKKQKVLAREKKQRERAEERGGGGGGGRINNVGDRDDRAKRREQDREDRRINDELKRRKRRGEDPEKILADIQKRKDEKEMEEARKKGGDAVKDLEEKRANEKKKMNEKNKEPKKPENAVVKSLKPIMKSQLEELIKINKALHCEDGGGGGGAEIPYYTGQGSGSGGGAEIPYYYG